MPGWAQTQAPLQASITESRYLPPAMYGQWSVTATLLETNTPAYFSPVVHDIWILEETGSQVTITNPSNGASATISVDKVEGNTATFHRTVTAGKNRRISEQPTVTVEGDRMYGQTIDQVVYLKEGQVQKALIGKYRLEAERISGARARFGQDVGTPEFEIEEIQIDPELKKKKSALDSRFNPR